MNGVITSDEPARSWRDPACSPDRPARPGLALPRLCRVPHASPAVAVDGLVMRYGDKVAVDGLSLEVEPQHDHRGPRPQRRRQDHHARDLRGLPPPAVAARCGCSGLDPVPRPPRPAPPDRRDAPGAAAPGAGSAPMEMLRHIAALHAHPLDVDAARGAARARRLRPHAVPTALAAGSSSGSGWRWRSSGGRSSCSSTSRPPGWTRRPGATTWELLEELRARRRDGRAHHALHGRGRAARRPDPHHRPRPADRQRLAARAHPRRPAATIRLVVTRPFPPGAPESLRRALGDRHRGRPSSTRSACSSPAPPTPPRWPRSRAGARRHDVLPGVADPRASATSRTCSSSSPGGSWPHERRHLSPRPGAAPLARAGPRPGPRWRRG